MEKKYMKNNYEKIMSEFRERFTDPNPTIVFEKPFIKHAVYAEEVEAFWLSKLQEQAREIIGEIPDEITCLNGDSLGRDTESLQDIKQQLTDKYLLSEQLKKLR